MGDVFKGWRRKAGVVTLAMACVSVAAWIRTLILFDALKLPVEQPMPFSYITVSLTVLSACLLLPIHVSRSLANTFRFLMPGDPHGLPGR